MRKVKYQAWIPERKVMLQVSRMTLDNEGNVLHVIQDDPEEHARNLGAHAQYLKIILREFTGLLDKNGVEIYEGDVLHFPELYGGVNGVVRWVGVRYYCLNKNHDNANSIDGDGYSWVCNIREVIGNIYENEELSQ